MGAGGSAPRTASSTRATGMLAAEQQDVDHLAGGLLAPARVLGDLAPQLVEAGGPVAAVALLSQRQRPGERAGLARQQIEVVVQVRAGAVLAVKAFVAARPAGRRART